MSNRNHFVPGKRAHMKKLINYQSTSDDYSCECFKDKYNLAKQGFNDPMISNNIRIAQMLSRNSRGRITFGDLGQNRAINNLGGIEGQPGGMPRILRNKF